MAAFNSIRGDDGDRLTFQAQNPTHLVNTASPTTIKISIGTGMGCALFYLVGNIISPNIFTLLVLSLSQFSFYYCFDMFTHICIYVVPWWRRESEEKSWNMSNGIEFLEKYF